MNSTTLSAEKRGNANFAQCAQCSAWFPIGGTLLARPEIKLHCPQCHHEFHQQAAQRIVRAG